MSLRHGPPRKPAFSRRDIALGLPPGPTYSGGPAGGRNALLAALPEGVLQRLRPKLQLVHLPTSAVLIEPGVPIADLYFPQDSVVAVSVMMENGSSAEVALIGREGVVGLRLLLGEASLNVRARVQSGGCAVKLAAQCLADEMARDAALLQQLLHYTAAFIDGVVQTAACNRHGSVEQRLCRWLLLHLDRLPGVDLAMTHESIAEALGVKREGITEAAGKLRRQGAIDYRRGHIRVLDRAALERVAREFYGTTVHEAAEPIAAASRP